MMLGLSLSGRHFECCVSRVGMEGVGFPSKKVAFLQRKTTLVKVGVNETESINGKVV